MHAPRYIMKALPNSLALREPQRGADCRAPESYHLQWFPNVSCITHASRAWPMECPPLQRQPLTLTHRTSTPWSVFDATGVHHFWSAREVADWSTTAPAILAG